MWIMQISQLWLYLSPLYLAVSARISGPIISSTSQAVFILSVPKSGRGWAVNFAGEEVF